MKQSIRAGALLAIVFAAAPCSSARQSQADAGFPEVITACNPSSAEAKYPNVSA